MLFKLFPSTQVYITSDADPRQKRVDDDAKAVALSLSTYQRPRMYCGLLIVRC